MESANVRIAVKSFMHYAKIAMVYLTLTTQWSTVQLCGTFLADPNTAVQYRLFLSGATGTPTVGYGFTLTKLQ